MASARLYEILADCVLALHVLFILWLVFGAFIVRRPILRWLHIFSLTWGVLVEVTPWPCPLTVLEKQLEWKAGIEPYQGGFLLHYLDKVVYPDISPLLLTVVGISICSINLLIDFGALIRSYLRSRRTTTLPASAGPAETGDLHRGEHRITRS